jgi:TPR repeat protein
VLVGCDADLETSRAVTREEGQLLADELQCPFFEASAEENTNVTEAFMTAACMGLQHARNRTHRRGKTEHCYKDHALQQCTFVDLPEDDCHFCSVCRALIAKDDTGARCLPCSYYLCRGCLRDSQTEDRDLDWIGLVCQRSTNSGDAAAQFDLGMCLANGEGVDRNLEEAAKWFQRAAEHGLGKGHAHAQFMLGKFYEAGKGVNKSHSKALAWFVRAAGQGHVVAKSRLHRMQVTELHWAAVRGDLDTVKALLDKKLGFRLADISAKDMYASFCVPSASFYRPT